MDVTGSLSPDLIFVVLRNGNLSGTHVLLGTTGYYWVKGTSLVLYRR